MEDTTLLQPEPERHYKPLSSCSIDWNMFNYSEPEEASCVVDWNKMVYNDEQLEEFYLRKQEKMFRPEFYEYLFSAPRDKTEMEKFFLIQSGFCIDEEEDDWNDINDIPIKRLVIDPTLHRNVVEDPSDAK